MCSCTVLVSPRAALRPSRSRVETARSPVRRCTHSLLDQQFFIELQASGYAQTYPFKGMPHAIIAIVAAVRHAFEFSRKVNLKQTSWSCAGSLCIPADESVAIVCLP